MAEENIYGDPQAASNVFANQGVPITLIPLDVTNNYQITWDFLNTTFANDIQTKEARFCHDLLTLIKQNSGPTSQYSLWDPLAASILADSSLIVQQETLNLNVITGPTTAQAGQGS